MAEQDHVRKGYRYAPCPSYDVEGMESWLSDMALFGLHLEEDGFFGGIAAFVKGEPKEVRYRLQAVKENPSLWSDSGGEPDPEDVAISEKYGWNYVARRHNFFIYRTEQPGVREMNTDPAVQALALKAVQRRCINDHIYFFVILGIDIAMAFYGTMVRTLIYLGLGLFLCLVAMMVWFAVDFMAEAVHLRRLQKKLRRDGCLNHEKSWREKARFYYIRKIVKPALFFVLVIIFLNMKSKDAKGEYDVPLRDFHEEVPFATMKDFAEGDYRYDMEGFDWTNQVRAWEHFISPVNYEWNENAVISRGGAEVLAGGLEVCYHAVRYEWLADLLVDEYMRKMRLEKNYEPLEFCITGVDECYMYLDKVHFPGAAMRKGNQVVFVQFYQYGDKELSLEEWGQIVADSLVKSR